MSPHSSSPKREPPQDDSRLSETVGFTNPSTNEPVPADTTSSNREAFLADTAQEQRLGDLLDDYLQALQLGTTVVTGEPIDGHKSVRDETNGVDAAAQQFAEFRPVVDQVFQLSQFLQHFSAAEESVVIEAASGNSIAGDSNAKESASLETSAQVSSAPPTNPAATRPPKPAAPDTIGGKFEVKEVLGRGGQATVYKVFDTDLKRHAVVKVYHTARTAKEQATVLKEGQTLAQVNSPYVARCLSAERHEGAPCLVMEYVAGQTLSTYHQQHRLNVNQSLAMVAKITEGLAAIQRRGLIHRDIKPANILVGDDGAPRLVDFGLAAPVASDALQSVSGTLAYMPPEQARGEQDRVGPSSDVFGIGAVLYELLTGRPPHHADSYPEMLEKARAGDVQPPIEVNPAIGAEVNKLCMHCLAKDPDSRPDSANELLREVRDVQASLAPSPWTSRRIAVVAACAALAAAVAIVLFVVFNKDASSPIVVAGAVDAEKNLSENLANSDEKRREDSPRNDTGLTNGGGSRPEEETDTGDQLSQKKVAPDVLSLKPPGPPPPAPFAGSNSGLAQKNGVEAIPQVQLHVAPSNDRRYFLHVRPQEDAPSTPAQPTGQPTAQPTGQAQLPDYFTLGVRGSSQHPDGRKLRQDFPLSVQLVGAVRGEDDKAIIQQGEEISLRIESPRSGYVGVWSLQDDGALQILPNEVESNHRLRAHQPRVAPGEPDDPQAKRKQLIASSISKQDEFLHVIVATQPLPAAEGSRFGPYVVLNKPQIRGGYKITTRGFSLEDEEDQSLEISEAVIPYRVVSEKTNVPEKKQ